MTKLGVKIFGTSVTSNGITVNLGQIQFDPDKEYRIYLNNDSDWWVGVAKVWEGTFGLYADITINENAVVAGGWPSIQILVPEAPDGDIILTAIALCNSSNIDKGIPFITFDLEDA